ncbi:unnamed protein product [Closterium sp. Naga37s-1]|nr:unnamed protein product [Closterium sp. Naga37s-1]
MGREAPGAQPSGAGFPGASSFSRLPKKEESQRDDETSDESSDEEEWTREDDKGREMQFSRILEGVVFAISGVANPERGELRGKAMEMGARYRPDWTPDCTVLVAAFPGTPKVRSVTADDGTIVYKRWVEQCYSNRRLMSISPHVMHLGRPWRQGGAADRDVDDGGGRRRRIGAEEGEQKPKRRRLLIPPMAGGGDMGGGNGGSLSGEELVAQWVAGDMVHVRAFLEEQEEQPPEGEVDRVAREGMLACFDDAIAGVEQGQALAASIASWPVVPRVLDPQTSVSAPPHLLPSSLPPLPISLGSGGAGGGECLRVLRQWRGMYERELGRMGERGKGEGGEVSGGGVGGEGGGSGGGAAGGERGEGSGGAREGDGTAGGTGREGGGHGGNGGVGDAAAQNGSASGASSGAAGTAPEEGERNPEKGDGRSGNPIDDYDTDSCSEGGVGEGVANPFVQSGREKLPVFKHREGILYLMETHAVTVVVGETGSGKTTQIPQYLVEAGWAAGGRVVACTQPRRVAAQMVASRVAEEMGVALGERVGYSIRFENVTTQGVTQIKFLTDGVLLREMMEDPLLSRYSVIMVDEAHERSLATDILLGLLKKVMRRRPDLRLVISSATLAADDVAAFFDTSHEKLKVVPGGSDALPSRKPAIMSVEGRSHPVQLLYLEEPSSDYLQTALDTVLAIHCQVRLFFHSTSLLTTPCSCCTLRNPPRITCKQHSTPCSPFTARSGSPHRVPPIGFPPSGSPHRVPPIGFPPSGSPHRVPPIGFPPSGSPHRVPPIGFPPSGSPHRAPPIGFPPSGSPHRVPPIGFPPSGSPHRVPPIGFPPSGSPHRVPPIGFPPSGSPHRVPPIGFPPSGSPHRVPPIGFPPSGSPHRVPPIGFPPSGFPPSGSPIGFPPSGSPIGFPPSGSPHRVPPIGFPPSGSPHRVPPIGFPPSGSPIGFPPSGSPHRVPPIGFPPSGSPHRVPPIGFPPSGSPHRVPPIGFPPSGSPHRVPPIGFPPSGSPHRVPPIGSPPSGPPIRVPH